MKMYVSNPALCFSHQFNRVIIYFRGKFLSYYTENGGVFIVTLSLSIVRLRYISLSCHVQA